MHQYHATYLLIGLRHDKHAYTGLPQGINTPACEPSTSPLSLHITRYIAQHQYNPRQAIDHCIANHLSARVLSVLECDRLRIANSIFN